MRYGERLEPARPGGESSSALCFVGASASHASNWIWQDTTVDYTIPLTVFVGRRTETDQGYSPTVKFIDGAVFPAMSIHNSSVVDMEGGLHTGSTIIAAWNTSSFNLTGGEIASLYVRDHVQANLSGVTIANQLVSNATGVVRLNNGTVLGDAIRSGTGNGGLHLQNSRVEGVFSGASGNMSMRNGTVDNGVNLTGGFLEVEESDVYGGFSLSGGSVYLMSGTIHSDANLAGNSGFVMFDGTVAGKINNGGSGSAQINGGIVEGDAVFTGGFLSMTAGVIQGDVNLTGAVEMYLGDAAVIAGDVNFDSIYGASFVGGVAGSEFQHVVTHWKRVVK